MSKDIMNFNSKGERHGYLEIYLGKRVMFKRYYCNGIRIDYDEDYYTWSGGLEKNFYI